MENLNCLEERGKFGSWLSIEETIEIRERAKTVWNALDSMNGKYRQDTILCFMSGFNTREISKFLNISVSSTESRLRRAKEKSVEY